MQRYVETSSAVTLVPLLALGLACTRGEVNLGEGATSRNLELSSRCAESTVLPESIYVANQAELDALTGCEEIQELRIVPFADIDLTPLASLRRITDAFELGAFPENLPEDPEEQRILLEPIRALNDAGWVDSLHGLEALESVGILYLSGTTVSDLTELQSLQAIEEGIVLRQAKNLVNFAGLEAIEPPSLVWVADSSSFESLAGLEYGPVIGSLYLERVPALANLDALGNVTSADTIMLLETGLATLPRLDQLIVVTTFNIEGNEFLTALSGFDALQAVTSFNINFNASLRSIPEFPQLTFVDTLVMTYNDALEEVALNFPALLPQTRTLGWREVQYSTGYLQLSNNAALRHISSPASFSALQFLSVFENPSLLDIDLGQLERADYLMIADNPALSSIVAPSLATVNTLEVIDNPLLSTAEFDDVDTFSRQISGNAEPSAP
jgi:hypothetical protein